MIHADDDALLRYRFETATREEAQAVADHLRRCGGCSARYAALCKQVDALGEYTAEPEDPEAQLQRALQAANQLRRTAAQPEAPAARVTPYPGTPVAARPPTREPEPEPFDWSAVLVWLGVKPGTRTRLVRLAAVAALVLTTAYTGLGMAYYVLRRPVTNTRISADISWLAGSEATAWVRVTDLKTTYGVEGGADVTLWFRCDDQRFELSRSRTGTDGITTPTFHVPEDAWGGRCRLQAETFGLGERDTTEIGISVSRQFRIHLSSDKPLYQPGQTIHLRALALQYPSQRPAVGKKLVLEVRDPKGNRLAQQARTLEKFGVTSLDFQLADDVPLGEYAVFASIDAGSWGAPAPVERLVLKVDRYALPRFEVSVAPERDTVLAGETLRATVRARTFFGKPVARADVTAMLVDRRGVVIGQELSGRTSANGEWSAEVELPATLAEQGSESVSLQVQVKDAAGQEERREQAISVARESLQVDLLTPDGGAAALDRENDLFILTSTPDGRPMPAAVELMDRGTGQVLQTRTGARGVAWLRLRLGQAPSFNVTAETADGRRTARTITLPSTRRDLTLQLDRALYRPGQTVKAEVEVHHVGVSWVELTAYRDGQTVLRQQAIVHDGRVSFAVPLPPGLSGSLELRAAPTPVYHNMRKDLVARRWIAVAEPRALAVTIAPDQPEYRPGTDAKIRFQVKDAKGQPTAALLGVSVVDESLFARSADLPVQARAAFLLERGLLAPRRGISAADVLASGDWTSDEQAAAAALFSMADEGEYPTSHEHEGLPDKVLRFRQERLMFEGHEARIAGLVAGLGVLLAALAALLRLRLPIPGRAIAAAAAGLGCWLAFEGPWSAGAAALAAVVLALEWPSQGEGWRSVRMVGAVLLMSLAFGVATSARKAWLPRSREEIWIESTPHSHEMSLGEEGRFREQVLQRNRRLAGAAADGAAPGGPGHGGVKDLLDPSSPPRRIARVRERFPETMFVRPELIADERGVAELTVPVADSITTWRVSAFASSARGQIGSAQAPLKVFRDFFVDVDAPPALVKGDEAEIPVAVHNFLSEPQAIRLEVQREDWFELVGPQTLTFKVGADGLDGRTLRVRALLPGKHKLTVRADGTRLSDAVARELLVSERGHQVVDALSGQLAPKVAERRAVVVPDQAASAALALRLYPNRVSLALEGLEGSLQMPHGCFEQTSSTHYPNVLIYDALQRAGRLTPEVEQRARGFIAAGYQRLLTFEVPGGGFEWFGRAPANQILSAYGLLELTDMNRLFPVDPAVIARTQRLLATLQTGDGSWAPDRQSLSDGLWRSEHAGRVTVTAYIAWALAESGARGTTLDKALEYLARNLPQSDDAYTDALATAAFAKAGHGSAAWAARRLSARAVREETRVRFDPAGATAYYGRGQTGKVETTAVAAQALRAAAAEPGLQNGALEYLLRTRDGRGSWFSTQATILALRALLIGPESAGDATVRVKVNGADAGTFKVKAFATGPTVIDLGQKARRGQNVVELEGDTPVAYQLRSSYTLPWRQRGDEAQEPLSLEVAYGRSSLRVGDVLPVTVKLTYRRPEASGMAMVQLGLPAGLAPLPEDLEALQASGKVARYEPDARTVSLYLDRLPSGAPVQLALRLKAKGRVRTSGVESRAYLSYAPEISASAPPTAVSVN